MQNINKECLILQDIVQNIEREEVKMDKREKVTILLQLQKKRLLRRIVDDRRDLRQLLRHIEKFNINPPNIIYPKLKLQQSYFRCVTTLYRPHPNDHELKSLGLESGDLEPKKNVYLDDTCLDCIFSELCDIISPEFIDFAIDTHYCKSCKERLHSIYGLYYFYRLSRGAKELGFSKIKIKEMLCCKCLSEKKRENKFNIFFDNLNLDGRKSLRDVREELLKFYLKQSEG